MSLASLTPDPLDKRKSASALYALARSTGCRRPGCYAPAAVVDAPVGKDHAVVLQTDHCLEHSDGRVDAFDSHGSPWVRLSPDADWKPADSETFEEAALRVIRTQIFPEREA